MAYCTTDPPKARAKASVEHSAGKLFITVCGLELNPRLLPRVQRLHCTGCGDCVDDCWARGKVLALDFNEPG